MIHVTFSKDKSISGIYGFTAPLQQQIVFSGGSFTFKQLLSDQPALLSRGRQTQTFLYIYTVYCNPALAIHFRTICTVHYSNASHKVAYFFDLWPYF